MKESKNINNVSENKLRKTFYTQITLGYSIENKAENAGKVGWQLMKIHSVFFIIYSSCLKLRHVL